jgi:hypothetical protein
MRFSCALLSFIARHDHPSSQCNDISSFVQASQRQVLQHCAYVLRTKAPALRRRCSVLKVLVVVVGAVYIDHAQKKPVETGAYTGNVHPYPVGVVGAGKGHVSDDYDPCQLGTSPEE